MRTIVNYWNELTSTVELVIWLIKSDSVFEDLIDQY